MAVYKIDVPDIGMTDFSMSDLSTQDTPSAFPNMNREQAAPNPPAYSDGPPPSYDSVFGKIKQAKADSPTQIQFVFQVVTLLFFGTICCGICTALLFAMPIAYIVVGAMHIHDCPRERYIPIYLVVFGVFCFLKSTIRIVQQVRERCKKQDGEELQEEEEDEKQKRNPVEFLINCFIIAWFIAGSVWVYRVHGDYQSDYPELDTFCNQTVYLFAFWTITIQYILLGLMILLCIVAIALACICT